ncbi:hypothetical protein ACSVDE_10965 [Pseudalkalibacillus sp. Hm43]|uniref:hypothetical protein n=1 Tax=Pseudalkalibacillus sp. Hm43 TaxID=3450742 RepID=UPI003F43C76E
MTLRQVIREKNGILNANSIDNCDVIQFFVEEHVLRYKIELVDIYSYEFSRQYSIKPIRKYIKHKYGIYVLFNESEKTAYVGKGNLLDRLNTHINKKEFWDKAIVFVSTSENVFCDNQLFVLEYWLINGIETGGAWKLNNINNGCIKNLSEEQLRTLYRACDVIITYLKYMKVNLFYRHEVDDLYYINGKHFYAQGYQRIDGKFVVLKGSTAAFEEVPSFKDRKKPWRVRRKLIHDKILEKKGSVFIFKEDFPFDNASDAASVITANAKSGSRWKQKTTSISYRYERISR